MYKKGSGILVVYYLVYTWADDSNCLQCVWHIMSHCQYFMNSDTCYVFSVVSYWTRNLDYSKAIDHKTNAFEMGCYKRMLRISWPSHTTNIDVLQKIGVKETTIQKKTVVICGPHNEKHMRTL